jgi:N-acetylmuramoyl-L-alanine amidase
MNKWTQTGVGIFISLFLAQCAPWYELDEYRMFSAGSPAGEKPREEPQSAERDFRIFSQLEKIRPEVQLASQSNALPISPEEELEVIVSQFTQQAPAIPAEPGFSPATFSGIGNYLESIGAAPDGGGKRFLIRLSRAPQYRANSITEPNHYRVYIDFFDTQLAASAQNIPVNAGTVYQIRSGQFNSRTARVVFDSRQETQYRIYRDQLQNSLVVEFEPAGWEADVPVRDEKPLISINRAAELEFANLGVVQELGLKIRRIIIDPGHGGSAPGAVGPSGLKEKEVVFSIAQWLKKLLTESGEFEAILTREDDREVALEERTRFANAREGDLFISIHVNASKRRESQGVETYYLSLAKDNASRSVAAFENQSATGEFSHLDHTLTRILKNSKVKESAQLAQVVQQHLVGRTQLYDGGVRHAGFFVLIGAQMPAILVEAGYISNPVEEQIMRQSDYHQRVAQGIFEGIQSYRRQTSMVAEQAQNLW